MSSAERRLARGGGADGAAGRDRRAGALLGAAAAAAALLRFWRLDHFSYWLDEIFEVFTFHAPWRTMMVNLKYFQTVQAPLDYVVEHFWEGLAHPSDWERKIPEALWGVACVFVFGALLKRRGGAWAGVCGAFLLALASYHVRYSQELRPYSLGMLTVCATLLALDRCLERPSLGRLAALFVAAGAAAYTLYVGALVAAFAGLAMAVEDLAAASPERRRSAQAFVARAPVLLAALALAYLPWWTTLRAAMRAAPYGERAAWTPLRLVRFFGYFTFSAVDWPKPDLPVLLGMALAAAGFAVALRRPGLRFLAAWGIGGFALLELLEQRHPMFDTIFHETPAGLAVTALAALPIAALLERRVSRVAGAALAAAALFLSLRADRLYFSSGRPDWRPLAAALRERGPGCPVYAENEWTRLCLLYYLNGPDAFAPKRPEDRAFSVEDAAGAGKPLAELAKESPCASLVLAAQPASPALREEVRAFPSRRFPAVEGGGGGALLVDLGR